MKCLGEYTFETAFWQIVNTPVELKYTAVTFLVSVWGVQCSSRGRKNSPDWRVLYVNPYIANKMFGSRGARFTVFRMSAILAVPHHISSVVCSSG
jgi:hypothetical protein